MPSFAAFGNDLYTGRRSIDFVGRRRTWYVIAAVAVLLSLAALGIRGLNLGLEFRGGSEFQINGTSVRSETVGVDAVHGVVPGAQVKVSKLGVKGDSFRIETDKLTEEQTAKVRTEVSQGYKVAESEVSTNFVGPQWGQDVSQKALTGLLVFLVAVALVIALYFRTWTMAMSAIVALVHDLILTVGVYALVGFEVTPASVIGFLTILGYSLYDTVVVFDKVRENTEHITSSVKRTYPEAANLAINQTLVRSINTSVVALLPVASILFIGAFVLGAGSLKDISLALLVGIAAGTYSSVFIATPLLADLRGRDPELKAQAERVRRKRSEAAQAAAAAAESADQEVLAGVASPASVGDAGGTSAAAPATAGVPAGAARGQGQGQRQQPRKGAAGGRNRPGGRKR